jgi:DNA-binding IclR family transcriptional regulator
MHDKATPQSLVKSATRTFEVLELFGRLRRPLTATEIGLALGYPKSSANALLRSLVALGYLSLDARSLSYFPSLALTRLGDWIPAALLGSGDAFEVMRELHERTQETVTLTVQSDLSCRFLKVLVGTHPISLNLPEGSLVPLFSTAVGTAILSQLPDSVIDDLLARANQRARRKSEHVDGRKIMRAIRATRDRGYAIVYDALIPHTGAVAMSLGVQVEGFPMAIAVGGLSERIRRHEAAIYRTMRASIARHLGLRAPVRPALPSP